MPRFVAFVAALAVALPGAALAHHGWTSYDENQTLTVTGKLSDVSWTNPHGGARIQHQGKQWTVVLAPITRMEARGLMAEDISKGQQVTLTGYPRRDGTPEMRIERIQVGGKTVELR